MKPIFLGLSPHDVSTQSVMNTEMWMIENTWNTCQECPWSYSPGYTSMTGRNSSCSEPMWLAKTILSGVFENRGKNGEQGIKRM